jgi:hypothetical protein
MADPPPRITDHRPDLPALLDDVLSSAMAKEPAQRPASASALLLEVNRAFTRRMRAAFTPPGPIEAPEETGIRPAEVDVPTRERDHPDETPLPETSPRAFEPAPPPPSPTERAATPGTPPPPLAEPEATRPAETERAAPLPAERGAPVAPPPAAPVAPPRTPPVAPKPGAAAAAPRRIGLVAAALLALAVVAFLLGRGGSDDGDGGDSQPVAAGPLTIDAPSGWRPAGAAFAVPGLRLSDDVTLAPDGDARKGAMAAGMTDAGNASMLPAPFLARLADVPPRDDSVELGELEGYRYEGLKPKGFGQPLTVYVSPTSEGVATVACAGPAGGGSAFLDECETAATTLGLASGTAFPLGGGERYSTRLDATFDRLNAARRSQAAALRKASTPAKQAAAGDALAASYRRAARSLKGAVVSPELAQDNARIVRALGDAGEAYADLAQAARQGKRARYRAAASRASAADERARRALRFIGG